MVIRIDALWLATEPVDMGAGAARLLAQVVAVFGAAQPHKLTPWVHLRQRPRHAAQAARERRLRRLVRGAPAPSRPLPVDDADWTDRIALPQVQFDALIVGLPWARLEEMQRTAAEDEADLAAQLAAPQERDKPADETSSAKRKTPPRRKPLPAHLRRVIHHHEPVDTTCGCGQPMTRVGEDVSERLDVIPAEFFVHRHIRGKWP